MKRITKIILLVFLALILSPTAHAEEYTYRADEVGEDAVRQKWDELAKNLPENVADIFGDYDIFSPTESVRAKSGAGFWIDTVWDMLTSAAREALPDLAALLTLILLMALSRAVLPDETGGVGEAFAFLGRVAVALPLISASYRAIGIAGAYLTNITAMMNVITPVMEVSYISSGSLNEAAVTTSGIAVAVTAIGNFNSTFMRPIVTVLFTLSAMTSVCGDVKLGGLTASVRTLLKRLWQIMTLFFSFMIGTQTVIARSADTLSTRTARFAISSMIPVAGGIIAEAYNTLKEGVRYIRVAAGVGAIIVIVLILLTGVIPLLVYKAAFGITSYASGMLGLERTSKLLDEIKGVMEFIIAIVLYSSMMFVFVLVLFLKSREV